jgi:8-oxo-dGTP pyrophosphatase MutT (NUDIX family)
MEDQIIYSYGIACVNIVNKSICMVKKNKTYAFETFVRARNFNEHMFDMMSLEEKILISKLNFDNIIRRCYYNARIGENVYTNMKTRFERAYLYDGGKNILAQLAKSKRSINGIWEIPKGRSSGNESNIDTAIREFRQETQIDIRDVNILYNKRFTYNFRDMMQNYCYVYFLAFTKKECLHNFNITEYSQYSEISDIMWFNMDLLKLFIDKQITAMCYLDKFAHNIINTAMRINRNMKKNNKRLIRKALKVSSEP